MTAVRLAVDAYRRFRAGEPEIILENRFFEKNPINLVEQVALIIRPALRFRTAVGEGPVRQVFYEDGCYTNDAYVVSADEFFRVHKTYTLLGAPAADVVTQIPGLVGGLELNITPEIVIRPDHVFIADGYDLLQTDGASALAPIVTPDDMAPVSMDIIDSYIIVVMGSSQRCYWINPGEITIDPLNFFEAERLPDWLYQVRTIGDQFWLLGQKTTEVWRHTGNALAPFQRIEGRLFDNGVWGGTAVKIKDDVVVVGNDGRVYKVSGGPQPVGNPGIAEVIRDAMNIEGLA